MNHYGTIRFMTIEESPKIPGMVRLDVLTRSDVDDYAAARGISYNAAMNILVRIGLRAEQEEETRRSGSNARRRNTGSPRS